MFLRRHNPLLIAVILLLCACGRQAVKAPVVDRTAREAPPRPPPPAAVSIPLQTSGANNTYHIVAPGDTLYSIAFEHRQDFQQVAKWNRLSPPYTIHLGDRIRVRPYPEELATPVLQSAPTSTPTPNVRPGRATPSPTVVQEASPGLETTQALAPGTLQWQWPTEGPLLKEQDGSNQDGQGIDIGGSYGQAVRAAAGGKVVYTGSGLVGYGQLIILKHSNNFLSAYAHNRRVLVKEGDPVSVGQIIAEMGSSGTDRPMLHFEIREDGKPADPMRYLPRR